MDPELYMNDVKIFASFLLFCVLLIGIVYRRPDIFRDWFDGSDVQHYSHHAIPIKRLDIPFTIELRTSEDPGTIEVKSCSDDWCLYTYKHIDIKAVMVDILKCNVANEEYYEMLKGCHDGEKNKNVYSSTQESHKISLSTAQFSGFSNPDHERRTTYPLLVIATDYKSTLVCLVHVGDSLVPTSYIIAKFYRDGEGVFYRLTSLYTSTDVDTDECSVCLANSSSCALLPCRHKCACEECTKRLVYCPICRAVIGSYFNTETPENLPTPKNQGPSETLNPETPEHLQILEHRETLGHAEILGHDKTLDQAETLGHAETVKQPKTLEHSVTPGHQTNYTNRDADDQ